MEHKTTVVTSSRFLSGMSQSQKDQLQKMSAIVVDERDFNSLDIPEPSYGEEVIGTLLPDEQRHFIAMTALSESVEEIKRNMTADLLETTSKRLRDKTLKSDENGLSQEGLELIGGAYDTEKVIALFQRTSELEFAKSAFLHAIRDRFGIWDHVLGVRSKKRIVKGERKW